VRKHLEQRPSWLRRILHLDFCRSRVLFDGLVLLELDISFLDLLRSLSDPDLPVFTRLTGRPALAHSWLRLLVSWWKHFRTDVLDFGLLLAGCRLPGKRHFHAGGLLQKAFRLGALLRGLWPFKH